MSIIETESAQWQHARDANLCLGAGTWRSGRRPIRRQRPALSRHTGLVEFVSVAQGIDLPSLDVVADQVAAERETMNSHAESLDSKAGVVLGFAGVLVGLGATAQPAVSNEVVFQVGLGFAVLAALLAAVSFLPRRYPVLEVARLRENNLMASVEETKLELLDTEILMVEQAAALVKQKGRGVRASVVALAVGAALVVAGTLAGTGGHAHV